MKQSAPYVLLALVCVAIVVASIMFLKPVAEEAAPPTQDEAAAPAHRKGPTLGALGSATTPSATTGERELAADDPSPAAQLRALKDEVQALQGQVTGIETSRANLHRMLDEISFRTGADQVVPLTYEDHQQRLIQFREEVEKQRQRMEESRSLLIAEVRRLGLPENIAEADLNEVLVLPRGRDCQKLHQLRHRLIQSKRINDAADLRLRSLNAMTTLPSEGKGQ